MQGPWLSGVTSPLTAGRPVRPAWPCPFPSEDLPSALGKVSPSPFGCDILEHLVVLLGPLEFPGGHGRQDAHLLLRVWAPGAEL